MYGKQTPKFEKHKKLPYLIHDPHTISLTNRKWEEYRRFVSIDPGGLRKNNSRSFALRIEKRPMDSNGEIISEIFEVVKFIHPDDEYLKQNSISQIYSRITVYLNRYKEYYFKSHVIIIEQQPPINTQSVRVMQHVISYFTILLANAKLLPLIIEIDNTLKTGMLNSPPNLNENGKKIWSIEMANIILRLRGDKTSIKIMNENKKKDDLADSILQIEALCMIHGWPSTYNKHKSQFNLQTTSNFNITLSQFLSTNTNNTEPNNNSLAKIVIRTK